MKKTKGYWIYPSDAMIAQKMIALIITNIGEWTSIGSGIQTNSPDVEKGGKL